MNAKEFLKSKGFINIDDDLSCEMTTSELIEFLEEYKKIEDKESETIERPNPIALRDSIMRELENIRKALDESIEGKIIEYMNKFSTRKANFKKFTRGL